MSLFDVMVDWLGYFPHLWWHRRETPQRTGMRHPLFCPYGPYAAGDGRLVGLAVLSRAHWSAFCLSVLEQPDLLTDRRYTENAGRVLHCEELERALEDTFRRRTADEWLERLEAAGIPSGRVNDVGDVMQHPQLEHNRLVVEVDSPLGPFPVVGSPFVVDGTRPPVGPVPGLGDG